MKVALIASPYPLAEAPSPPLGLCYAAAAFEAAGAEVCILDYIVRGYSPEKLKAELSAFEPDVIGTSAVTMNFLPAAGILQTAKKVFPRAVTVMGGPHVSFDFDNTLRQFPEIDLIVVGEGEQTIMALLPVIADRAAWPDIPGIAFRDNRAIRFTGPRKLVPDLDRLPLPARHLLPMSRYLALGYPISIITSRGCPGRCIFCQGRRMVGGRIRNRNPRLVTDEIEILLAYGFERINFADDFFTSNPKRVKDICAEIQRRGLRFSWAVFARADSVTPELLAVMQRAGCDTIFFGFESGNPQMLNRIKKDISLDRVRRAVADAKTAGLRVFGSFIVGLPGETAETLMDSHRFARELNVEYGYHFLVPFPGTDVREKIDQYDLELLTDDWNAFDANHAIVRTADLNPEMIEQFVKNFYTDEIEKEEARMEKSFRAGALSSREQLTYLGRQKLDIVFSLLSQDLLENAPPLPFEDHLSPISQLSRYLAGILDRPMDGVLLQMQSFFDRGYLNYREQNGQAIWHWC